MPEEVGKLCEEGFQITAWKGIYMCTYIGIRQSYLIDLYMPHQVHFQQHHYMHVKYFQLMRTLVV